MKNRIISAILLLVVFVPFLVVGGMPFAVLMLVVGLLGLHELIKARETKKEFPFLMKLFAYLLVGFFILNNYNSNTLVFHIDYRAVSFLIFAFLIPLIVIDDNKRYNLNDALFLMGSTLFLGMSFNLLILIRNYSFYYVLFLFFITVITDTFAYIGGSFIGQHELAPKISPRKTIEGLVVGTVMGVFVSMMFYITVIDPSISLVSLFIVAVTLSLIGQLGDLVFSSVKRYYGIKDFSHFIPGHGGILDRFDSIIFVALAAVMFLTIL